MSLATIVKSLGQDEFRLNELGKIKIGGLGQEKTAGSGRSYRTPRKDDHFTITTLHRRGGKPDGDLMPDDALMAQLCEQYADEDGRLRQIPIRLLSDDIDDALQTAWVWYGKKTVGARSDGDKLTWFYHPQTMKPYEQPVEDEWTDDRAEMVDARGNKLFKLHSVLNCVVAAKEARWGGVYKFRTISLVSFKQLYASLLHISQLTGGILRGMPLMLCVRPLQVSPNGTPTTVHVVHVELRGAELVEIQRQALAQAQWSIENKTKMIEVQRQYRALLAPPGAERGGEAGDIAAEFAPETQTIESAPADYDLIDGDIEPPGEPGKPDGAESETPARASDALSPAPTEWFVFADSVVRLAVRDGISEPTAEAALEELRRTKCGSPLTQHGPVARKQILDAIEHGAFDWVNAKVAD